MVLLMDFYVLLRPDQTDATFHATSCHIVGSCCNVLRMDWPNERNMLQHVGLFYTVCRQEAFGTFVVFSVSALLFLVADEHDGVLYSSLIHPLRSRFSPSWGESQTCLSCQWCFKLNWCACSDATMLHEGGQTIATRNNNPDNKRNVAWCCTKVWRKSNFIQHRATSCNIVQHVACNNVAWNVAY